ncbi:hypothetical protein DXD60_07560 [Bifidobacterium adolescentis]|jgi:hypothetical protein|uniref:hypothetical protein n=1 Tax=Bifidobacterium adolescentis TaxID=1680 RepID=UPI000E416EC9|nr:hypothetical protein [Bifidobacterium adolescentis]RGJ41684.1 hypothetical protein DXD60_07560 [Bifidobacterium adolescentis]DAI98950.1 MAG TPA: hypothetical protein [Caudoviricetes sp.]
MTKKFAVDEDWMRKNVLSNPTVTSALNAKARRLAPIVKRIALKEGDRHYAESVRVVQGRRPGTKSPSHIQRPYARIVVGDEQAAEKEYGGRLPKKGFLRRAIAEMGD